MTDFAKYANLAFEAPLVQTAAAWWAERIIDDAHMSEQIQQANSYQRNRFTGELAMLIWSELRQQAENHDDIRIEIEMTSEPQDMLADAIQRAQVRADGLPINTLMTITPTEVTVQAGISGPREIVYELTDEDEQQLDKPSTMMQRVKGLITRSYDYTGSRAKPHE